ncbi:MAG TPA: F0F1 ATP synthase subunit A [Mycobacteriales bacterium]|jgi:F0F1-type ATP synthase, subunit a
MSDPALAVGSIEIGHHVTGEFLGFTLNLDTIWTTAIAGLIVVGLGLHLRRRLTSGVPSGLQLVFETVTGQLQKQVEATMGLRTAPFVVPLAVTLFLFILVANWLSVIPSGHGPEYLPPPTADVNLVYAMALLVVVWMHVTGVRKRGAKNYFGHFAKPYWWLVPINIIEELARPVTLSLRLFGNIFSGGIMVALITLFPAYILWGPNVVWKLFDLFIGLIQAFIFALLTILYFGSAASEEGGH